MKTWSKFIPNEWLILSPALIVLCIINYYTEDIYTYLLGNIVFITLLLITLLRIFVAIKNKYEEIRNKKR